MAVVNPPTVRTRPLGVAILSVLVGIYGVLLILGGVLIMAGAAAFSFLGGFGFGGLAGVALGAIVLVIGLIILGVALGLWHLRMWALVLALIVTLLEMVSYGISGSIVSFGFIFSLIIFVYLLAVHRHFL